jgi:hypothetical protein
VLNLLILSVSAFAAPAYFTEKADTVPNICQSCFPKIIQWEGKPHCAPAAVSNSLVWLSQNGYPELQPFHGDDILTDQAKLVNTLGEVMNTTKNGGTSPRKVLSGLKKYFEQNKIKYKRLAAVGWRDVPDFVANDNTKVNLDWIKDGVLAKGSTWILIGWCKYELKKRNNCKIYDGHWMTVVGYGKDRSGKTDPDVLIVHDPAERAERKNYYPTIAARTNGTIDDTISGENVLNLQGDVILKPGADLGVIQGAYRLEL